MDFFVWTAFVAASAAIAILLGPGVASIIGFAFASGRKTALVSVAGMALGDILAVTVSLAGAGAVLAASALAFSILKYAGAAYLIVLGILAIVKSGSANHAPSFRQAITPRVAFLSNFALGAFHPKTIIFFAAFAPQFIDPERPYLQQAVILAITFVCLTAVAMTIYALSASRASRFVAKPKFRIWTQRAGGGVLIASGIATAAMRK